MMFNVVVSVEYTIESEDAGAAINRAEECLADELSGVTAFTDVFEFEAKEVSE